MSNLKEKVLDLIEKHGNKVFFECKTSEEWEDVQKIINLEFYEDTSLYKDEYDGAEYYFKCRDGYQSEGYDFKEDEFSVLVSELTNPNQVETKWEFITPTRMLVSDDKEKWSERVVIAVNGERCACILEDEEESFVNGDLMYAHSWPYHKPLPTEEEKKEAELDKKVEEIVGSIDTIEIAVNKEQYLSKSKVEEKLKELLRGGRTES